jgi:hypothetical protein
VDEVIDCRKLHDEELHILYSSPSIVTIMSRKMRWEGHVETSGEEIKFV